MTFEERVKQKEEELLAKKLITPLMFFEEEPHGENAPIKFFKPIEVQSEERIHSLAVSLVKRDGYSENSLEPQCDTVQPESQCTEIQPEPQCTVIQPEPQFTAIQPEIQQACTSLQNAVVLPPPQRVSGNVLNISNSDNSNSKNKYNAYNIAQKFIRMMQIKVCGESIYLYTEGYYKKLSTSDCMRSIMELCRTEIERGGTSKCLPDILNFIRYEPKLLCESNDDTNNHFVSFLNCVLDTENNYICRHSPAYFTTYCLQCHYSTALTAAPAFDTFLCNITGGDTILQERICEMIGYILTPDTNAKVLFLLQGCSNSGKSVLSSLIRGFFNEEAVSDMDVHELCEKFAASDLEGKALCISPDLPSEPLDAKSVSKLKQFTGNDVVSADVKYKDRTKFKCSAKFLLATNHPFLIRGNDEAFFKRVVAIPFNYSVPKDVRDYRLPERLKGERDAIASRVISAYYRLKRNNYTFAGSYNINSSYGIHSDTDRGTNIDSLVYSYLMNRYEPYEGEPVFIADIYDEFINEYAGINVPLNLFSKLFCSYAAKEYNANKERRRRSGSSNPTSCITGIRRKTI